MRRSMSICAVLFVGAGALLAGGSPAMAATPSWPTDNPSIQSQFTKYHVSKKDQAALLRKLDQGKPWDSMTSADPISIAPLHRSGYAGSVERFADGSVLEQGTELPRKATPAELDAAVKEASPFVPASAFMPASTSRSPQFVPATWRKSSSRSATGIQLCTAGTSAGVSYKSNCQVYYSGISWSSSFRANYQQWASGAAAQYKQATRNTVAYTLTVSDEAVTSLNGGKWVRYSLNLHPAGWGNIPFWLDLRVSPTSAFATYGP